eukprot:5989626-Lingulodinium_polyedra.AAC.1
MPRLLRGRVIELGAHGVHHALVVHEPPLLRDRAVGVQLRHAPPRGGGHPTQVGVARRGAQQDAALVR